MLEGSEVRVPQSSSLSMIQVNVVNTHQLTPEPLACPRRRPLTTIFFRLRLIQPTGVAALDQHSAASARIPSFCSAIEMQIVRRLPFIPTHPPQTASPLTVPLPMLSKHTPPCPEALTVLPSAWLLARGRRVRQRTLLVRFFGSYVVSLPFDFASLLSLPFSASRDVSMSTIDTASVYDIAGTVTTQTYASAVVGPCAAGSSSLSAPFPLPSRFRDLQELLAGWCGQLMGFGVVLAWFIAYLKTDLWVRDSRRRKAMIVVVFAACAFQAGCVSLLPFSPSTRARRRFQASTEGKSWELTLLLSFAHTFIAVATSTPSVSGA